MVNNELTNILGEEITKSAGGSMLDGNNVVWKHVNGKDWQKKRLDV